MFAVFPPAISTKNYSVLTELSFHQMDVSKTPLVFRIGILQNFVVLQG